MFVTIDLKGIYSQWSCLEPFLPCLRNFCIDSKIYKTESRLPSFLVVYVAYRPNRLWQDSDHYCEGFFNIFGLLSLTFFVFSPVLVFVWRSVENFT